MIKQENDKKFSRSISDGCSNSSWDNGLELAVPYQMNGLLYGGTITRMSQSKVVHCSLKQCECPMYSGTMDLVILDVLDLVEH